MRNEQTKATKSAFSLFTLDVDLGRWSGGGFTRRDLWGGLRDFFRD